MADATLKEEIIQEVDSMTPEMQERVLKYVRDLKRPAKSGKDILQLAGILTHEEAQEWLDAIEEGCEQVDPNEW